MIEVRGNNINEFELIVVINELERRGVKWATVYDGNDCVWVSRGSASIPINEYYIFNEGRLVDIQID
jgi:hypothetical protein